MSFKAKYDGSCARCLGEIWVGDQCDYDDRDRIVHAGCVDAEQLRAPGKKVNEVCTECFMVRPCEHDDERKTA